MKARIVVLSIPLILFFYSCAKPYGVYYKAKKGETLYSISVKYKINYDELKDANSIEDEAAIKEGEDVFLPGIKAIDEASENVASAETSKKPAKVSKQLPPKEESKNAFAKTHPSKKKKGEKYNGEKTLLFDWPANGIVNSPFGVRDGVMHEGIDIKLEIGSPVSAAADGKVIFSGSHGGYGNVVIIQHKNNYFTIYSHNDALVVREGQMVKKGEKIALSGKTGKASGPHLHFEIRKDSKPADPLDYLPKK